MHQALYRKWRPQRFDDVCGQEHITSILKYETEHGQFSHAYLFCGSRGTGKTTCAKILAKAVNCLSPENGNPCGKCAACRMIDSGAATDVLEMDAASNNGVEDIRGIRDEVAYAPSALKYRVYIVDEVHMLSQSAFNALLKTLEEPPAHVVFILATTELQKLPATIISRCQRFDFRRIAMPVLRDRLLYIAGEEKINLDPDAAQLLARLAQGGMRDAISLFELCAGTNSEVTVETVNETVGITGRGTMISTARAIADKDYDTLLGTVAEIVRSSKDIAVFWQDLLSLFRDLLVMRTSKSAAKYLDLTDAEAAELSELAGRFTRETLLYICGLTEDALFAMQKSNSLKRVVAEMTLLRMCDETLDTSNAALAARLSQLEDTVAAGGYSSAKLAQSQIQPKAESIVPLANQAKQEAPSSVAIPPSDTRILHPVKCWLEVGDRVAEKDSMVASFVRQAHGFRLDNGEIIVQFDNKFLMDMLSRGNGKELLRGALSVCLRREVTDTQLIFEEKATAPKSSVIDEILEASDTQD